MVAALADIEGDTRREPDFERLKEMIDVGLKRKGLPSYRVLGRKIDRSVAVIYGIINDGNWPSYDTLIRLAAYFEEPRSEWLVVGGFPPNALPPSFTKLKPAFRREFRELSPEQRELVIEELRNLNGGGDAKASH